MFHQIKKSLISLRLQRQPSKELVSPSDGESFIDNDKVTLSDSETKENSNTVSQHEALDNYGVETSTMLGMKDPNKGTDHGEVMENKVNVLVSESTLEVGCKHITDSSHEIMKSIQSPRFMPKSTFTDIKRQSEDSPLPQWESVFARFSGNEDTSQSIFSLSSNNTLDEHNDHADNPSPSLSDNNAIHLIQSFDDAAINENWFSPTRNLLLSHTVGINGSHLDSLPVIMASQSLPDRTGEMLDPMTTKSYRMRVMKPLNIQEVNITSLTGAKSNVGSSEKNRTLNENLDGVNETFPPNENHSVTKSDVSSFDTKSQISLSAQHQKWTPSDQKWYSPRQKWIEQRKENLDSPLSIHDSSTSSLPSFNDDGWDAAAYRRLLARRTAGGTPVGAGSLRRSKATKTQKSTKNDSGENVEVDTAKLLPLNAKGEQHFQDANFVRQGEPSGPKDLLSDDSMAFTITTKPGKNADNALALESRSDENLSSTSKYEREEIIDNCFQDDDISALGNKDARSTKHAAGCYEAKSSSAPEASEHFEWAYDVWHRKGLLNRAQPTMQKNAQSNAINVPPLSDSSRKASRSLGEKKEVTGSVSRGIGDKVKRFDGRKGVGGVSSSHTQENGTGNNKGFSTILQQWRTVSDDKPCSHFLSPEFQQSHSGRLFFDNVGKSDSLSVESDKRIPCDDYLQEKIKDKLLNEKNDAFASDLCDVAEPPTNVREKVSKEKLRHSEIQGSLTRRMVRDLVNLNSLDKRFKSKDVEIREETSAGLLQRNAPGRHTYRTLCREFLSDDLNKNRSKSVPRIQQADRDQQIQCKTYNSFQNSPDIFANRTRNEMNEQTEEKKYVRSKSLPRLRENSQMARSLSNLRSKLTKEYSDQVDEQASTVQPKRSSRLVLDLLEQRKTGLFNINTSLGVPTMVEVSRRSSGSTRDYRKKVDSPNIHRIIDQVSDFEDATISTKSVSTRSHVDSCRKSFEVCRCSTSLFSGDDEMIDFYLPLTGTACVCGKRQAGLRKPDEPTSLVNILRPWQVEFLGSYGIFLGDQLVKAHHRSAKELAQALRRYRKRQNMKTFHTKNCTSALKIWSKTSKSFVRSIRAQIAAGTLAPDFEIPNPVPVISSFFEFGSPCTVLNLSGVSSIASSPRNKSITSRQSGEGLEKTLREV